MPGLFHLGAAVAVVSILSVLVDQRLPLDGNPIKDGLSDILTANGLNTTVIILNWSRFSNVKKITSTICESLLEDIVDGIVIWNNNLRPIVFSDFVNTTCPEEKLQIVNSPENLYFQARYMACAQSKTSYCFIQDDDYLVLPEVIRALALRIEEASLPSIHLQPADEMLSSRLRTISIEPRVHATFAWLGYGSIITRTSAIEFLTLLDKLQLSAEEHQMADNYFTILRNEIPERWFEPGIPLGGGQAFTVGSEGEERNNRHIIRAAELLDAITNSSDAYHDFPYVNFSPRPTDSAISRAPCHGLSKSCIFVTSIKLLSDIGIEPSMSAATEILNLEKNRYQKLGHAKKEYYLGFPPSSAVDGRYETAFRSPESKYLYGLLRSSYLIRVFFLNPRTDAKKDDWIMLDLTRTFSDRLEFVLVVRKDMGAVLQKAVFETSRDGTIWDDHSSYLDCKDSSENIIQCRAVFNHLEIRFFRLCCLEDVDKQWVVHEMYVDFETNNSELKAGGTRY